MNYKIILLLDSGIPGSNSFLSSLTYPFLIIGIAIGLVILSGLLCFLFKRSSNSSSQSSKTHRLTKSKTAIDDVSKKRRKRRRRKKDHRKRNPTLSEAGGLPPVTYDPNSGESSKKA